MPHFIRHFLCAAILTANAAAAETPAQEGDASWSETSIAIPTLQMDIRSAHTGRVHRIFVHVPRTPAPEKGHPVLYLLDGNATYPTAALLLDSMLGRAQAHGITPGIIVGVGYPVDTEIEPVARTEDYTPPASDLTSTGDPSGHPQGGERTGSSISLKKSSSPVSPGISRSTRTVRRSSATPTADFSPCTRFSPARNASSATTPRVRRSGGTSATSSAKNPRSSTARSPPADPPSSDSRSVRWSSHPHNPRRKTRGRSRWPIAGRWTTPATCPQSCGTPASIPDS